MGTMACALYFVMSCCLVLGRASVEQLQISDYNHEMLQPLTKFRQAHRRTVDGRLCAAAFVQDRTAYTGCTDAPNPVGESGRPWCYVEAQLGVIGSAAAWEYCAPAVDYDAVRGAAAAKLTEENNEIKSLVTKLQKAQRAAEAALDLYQRKCSR